MSKHPTEHIRTIALVGQSGSGKTTLAEALLVRAGAIPAAGSVERGTTVCDYQPLEKSVGHSLKMAVASFEPQGAHAGHRIHLLDTPGYPDFLGHSLPALAAVETAAIVINAQNGIEMMTNRFMQWAGKRGLDRLIIVNKIDAENVNRLARMNSPVAPSSRGLCGLYRFRQLASSPGRSRNRATEKGGTALRLSASRPAGVEGSCIRGVTVSAINA